MGAEELKYMADKPDFNTVYPACLYEGFIGGEALAKGADEFGESIGKTAVRIGDIWEDDSKNIGEKLLGTVGEAGIGGIAFRMVVFSR